MGQLDRLDTGLEQQRGCNRDTGSHPFFLQWETRGSDTPIGWDAALWLLHSYPQLHWL